MAKPSFGNVLKTGFITGAIAAGINLVIWFIAGLFDRMVFPFYAVIASSIIGLLAGSVIYFVMSRFLGARTNLVFTVVSVIFLALYAFAPVNAMSQEAMPGIGLFNTATMIVAQIMHIVSGALAIVRFRKLMA